jgi:hypothetical protein
LYQRVQVIKRQDFGEGQEYFVGEVEKLHLGLDEGVAFLVSLLDFRCLLAERESFPKIARRTPFLCEV